MVSQARMQRLFFALWPPEDVRAKIADSVGPIIGRAEARPIPVENLHITLAFLGAVPVDRIPSVTAAAEGVESSPVSLKLGRVEVWRGADILCLTPDPSDVLNGLVERLRVSLLEQHVEPDRKDFRPHVTLARDWHDRRAEGALGPFEWASSDFVLVASEPTRSGSTYRIIGRWPLRGPSTQPTGRKLH